MPALNVIIVNNNYTIVSQSKCQKCSHLFSADSVFSILSDLHMNSVKLLCNVSSRTKILDRFNSFCLFVICLVSLCVVWIQTKRINQKNQLCLNFDSSNGTDGKSSLMTPDALSLPFLHSLYYKVYLYTHTKSPNLKRNFWADESSNLLKDCVLYCFQFRADLDISSLCSKRRAMPRLIDASGSEYWIKHVCGEETKTQMTLPVFVPSFITTNNRHHKL